MTKLPPLSFEKLQTTQEKKYSPEQFGLDREEVYDYRTKLFTDDMVLENGKSKESDGLFLYKRKKNNDPTGKECGGYYFSQVPGDGDYSKYITEEEKMLFTSSSILKILSKYNVFIEYGPGLGDANKLRKWVLENREFKQFRKYIVSLIRHIGLDISGYTAEQFTKEYKDNLSIHGECIPTEWSKSNITKDVPNAAHVMFGGTPGAYTREQLIQLIKSFSSGSHFQKSPLFLSFFSAPTEPDKKEKIEQIKNAYRCNAAKQFVMKGIESLGIPIDSCEYAVHYQEGTGKNPDRIRVGAQLKKDITIDVGGGKQMTKKAGEYIWAVSSRRYTDEQFTELLKEAGTTGIKLHGEGGIKVAESYLPRKKFTEKVKKRAKNIGLIIAGTAALNYGTHEYGKYSKLNDARDYALQEMAYKNIEYPLYTKFDADIGSFENGSETNDNTTDETRLERLNFITDHIFAIIHTEYKGYNFPDDDVLKAAIMRFVPDNLDYFTKSKGPDEHYFAFVNNVFMPYLFASFGNEDHIGLYSRLQNDDLRQLLEKTRTSTSSFFINNFSSDAIQGDGFSIPGDYEVEEIGFLYFPNNKGVYKKIILGKVNLQGNEFLIAGDDESGYSLDQARKVLDFVDEKGYASNLTNQIVSLIDPINQGNNHEMVKNKVFEYIISMNKKGYDFSWLCKGNKEDEIKKFIGGFLLNTGTQLDDDILCLLKDSGVKDINELQLSSQVDQMIDFLKIYYGQHGIGIERGFGKKDYLGVRNFLVQVVCTGYLDHINSSRSRNDEPLIKQNIIQTLRRLSDKLSYFGFDVQENKNVFVPLEMLYKDYDQYKNQQAQSMSYMHSSLEQLYLGSVMFTSDGRCFIVNGSYHPIAGFELTEQNTFDKMDIIFRDFNEKFAQEMFSTGYGDLPVMNQEIIINRSLNEIKRTYLNPTYEGAYDLAKGLSHLFKD